ncbi:MAG: hypothetical protein PHU24_11615 [Sphaerochaetaceae bacterium]|nr:hypothetical protein [Sphaerochaetaceae bacterium]NLO61037.1 hypothetical protein [Spirochaetales bacterium]MDD2407088.1 hypothetical protein [Sphaerochaetaceae bacterium]MDD3671753.1 hypothetical protein [Sphaerochaetaceae bacterium]MDD4260082.1 hypothetical protein [Sphaerochaetaceae bacterium]
MKREKLAKLAVTVCVLLVFSLFSSCMTAIQRQTLFVDKVIAENQPLFEARQFESIIDQYERALVEYPQDARLLYNMAFTLAVKGDYQTSAETFGDLARLYPENVNYALAHASILILANRSQEAIEELERAILMDKYNEEASLLLIEQYVSQNQIRPASEIANRLYLYGLYSETLFSHLATIEERLGNPERKHSFEQLAELYVK